jgi:uncharacterized protein YndB with AHSA1/START domain
MTDALGSLTRTGTQHAVHLERRYEATPEEVWAVLVEPTHVRNWLAEMTIEPRAGGRLTFDWGGGNQDEGIVREFDPPRVFEYTWTRRGDSVIRFELRPEGDGTLLVLDHAAASLDQAISVGAGWQSHLDAMEALLAGSPTTPDVWAAEYERFRPAYEEQAATLG